MKQLIGRILIPAVSLALLFVIGINFATPGAVGAASPVYVQTRLLSSDTTISDHYGTSVSLDGDTAIVGADAKDGNKGAAYIFAFRNTVWSQQAKITAGDGASGDHFGVSVDLSGDTAIVGACGKLENRGAAYIFVRNGITWTQQAKLTPSDFEAGDYFGCSVSISGNTAVIGAYGRDGNTGTAYVFVRSGTTWSQQARLEADNAEAEDCFGYSVSISGDTAAVGAYGKENFTGALYIYTRSGTAWGQQADFTALDSAVDDHFGYSVSVSGETVIAGAWKAVSLKGTTGAAYVFVRSDSVWTQQAKITSNDPESFDRFGISVAVDCDMAMVGADWKYGGAAYMFTRTGYKWAQQIKFTTSDAATGDRYGAAVSAGGGKVLVGSFAQYNNMGAAYIYSEMLPLTVEVLPATSIHTTSVTLNGSIISMGTATVVNTYFEYGKTAAYGNVTTTQALTDTGPFSADIINLDPNTVYHFRIRADGGSATGVVYSQDMSFTTAPVPPSLEAVSAEPVYSTTAILNGTLGSLGTASSVSVYFEYGTTLSYGSRTDVQPMTAVGAFSATVTGLNPDSSYHFRAVADGGTAGVSYSDDMLFSTTPVTVFVEILPASDVQTTSATLNASLTSLGTAASADVCFEYGTTTSYGTTTQTQTVINTGTFSAILTGLAPDTAYHFRAKAAGGQAGVAYSQDMAFTTAAVLPSVGTAAATSVQSSSAVINGNLVSIGSMNSVSVYFEYGTTTGYGNTTAAETLSAAGTFDAVITGLAPHTEYHFRAVADGDAAGLIYGQDMAFITSVLPPSLGTSSAASVRTDSAVLNGNITSMGSAAAVSIYFEYGETAAYGTISVKQTVTSTGAFSIGVSELDPNKTYHFRAVADGGEHGKTYSADVSFTTGKTSYTLFIWLGAALAAVIAAAVIIAVIMNKRGNGRSRRRPTVRPYIETISDEELLPDEEKLHEMHVPPAENAKPDEAAATDGDTRPEDSSDKNDDLPLIK